MYDIAKIIGLPPIRFYRKNNLKENEGVGIYVKVIMDEASYLRKIKMKRNESVNEWFITCTYFLFW